jgi:hypothetical protein
MQHHGGRSKDGRKVELLCYLVKKGPDWEQYNGPEAHKPSPDATTFCEDAEPVELLDFKGKTRKVAKLYRFYRRPAGMFGVWVVFRYNGKDNVPDLSVPISLHKLPRDAKPLTDEEMRKYWFTDRSY